MRKTKAKLKYIDKSNMDLSVKSNDDFYLYANDKWKKANPVPASKVRWGNFNVLRQVAFQ